MKVLLAVDGSFNALQAAHFLTKLPLPTPLALEIATVVNPPEVLLSTQSELWYPKFLEHQEDFAKETLESAQNAISSLEADVATKQMMGHIGHTLVQRAEEESVDLIVVAAKGHSAVERILLGSISDYVATHAKCSVLVVRPPSPDAEGNTKELGTIQRVGVAVDCREASSAVVNKLCHFPWSGEETFRAVTASVKLEVFREDILASTVEESARRRTEAKRCADAAAARLSECGVHSEGASIEVEHVGEGLVQDFESHDSDLVVLGDTGRGVVTRLLLGSTSRYVLRHVHCSVLIIRG